jgi:multidrug efflux pump
MALGVAVFSGMLGVTVFGIFFTPVFYVVIRWFSGRKAAPPRPVAEDSLAVVSSRADGSLALGHGSGHDGQSAIRTDPR